MSTPTTKRSLHGAWPVRLTTHHPLLFTPLVLTPSPFHSPFAPLPSCPLPFDHYHYHHERAPVHLPLIVCSFQSADITYQSPMFDSWAAAATNTNRNSEDPMDVPSHKEWDTSAHQQTPSRPDPVRHNYNFQFRFSLHTILPPSSLLRATASSLVIITVPY